jgi:hypothetical protein
VPSLTRSRDCNFQFLLGIASADFLRSESHGTYLTLRLYISSYGYENDCIAVDYLLTYLSLEVKLWWMDSIECLTTKLLNWISVTSLYLFYRLLWNMIDEITLSGNMCFIFIHRSLYKHILLMQPRGGISVDHWVVAEWKSDWIFFYNSNHTAYYTKGRFLECVRRELALLFTVCALTNSSTDLNSTVMRRWVLLAKHVILLKFWWKC